VSNQWSASTADIKLRVKGWDTKCTEPRARTGPASASANPFPPSRSRTSGESGVIRRNETCPRRERVALGK